VLFINYSGDEPRDEMGASSCMHKVRNRKLQRSLGIPRRTWEDNIKLYLKEDMRYGLGPSVKMRTEGAFL
jgi:hypothetical protein